MFNNYEINKLVISAPEITNLIIMVVLTALILLSSKRKVNNNFMDKITTNQARGIASLIVVIGHLWVFVAKTSPELFFSGIGLAIFLLCSGYGISKSLNNDKYKHNVYPFVSKRIKSIMFPYWVATILILIFDYLLLHRTYKISHIFLTLIGINLYGVMHHFDYSRWYITLLVFWYLAAIISFRYSKNNLMNYMPFLFGGAFFILDYYILNLEWSQFIAFPLGWWLARNEIKYRLFLIKNMRWGSWGFFILSVFLICIKNLLAKTSMSFVPSICEEFGKDMICALAALSIVNYLSSTRRYSSILMFIGKHSYEIFLLHGVFLIKYNPFFQRLPFLIAFSFYLSFIMAIAWLMHMILQNVRLPART
jgi:peptidoglycan/LPS O-acetylase OafA/YrhL